MEYEKYQAKIIVSGNFKHYYDGTVSINYTTISNLKQLIVVK